MRLAFFSVAFCLLHACYSEDWGKFCHPADCAANNCYCTDKVDGWLNGGGFCSKNSRSCGCKCDNAGTSCKDYRCPDDYTQYLKFEGYQYVGVGCYLDDPVRGRLYAGWQEYDFCYTKSVPCDYGKCAYGESLVGCGRISAGSCQKCPTLEENKYWDSKSSCTQNVCSLALSGKFFAKQCTTTSDAVIANCSQHSGNRDYIVPNSRDTYYCPGGGLVLPLPENSQPTADYSSYECLPGFYQAGAYCLQCPPGFACKYGRKFECPVHYYSSTFGMPHCTICTRQCSGSWQNPLRCPRGSTANPGCISCGACDYDPRRGISCVMEAYEMQGLPDKCIPRDVQGDVAVCQ